MRYKRLKVRDKSVGYHKQLVFGSNDIRDTQTSGWEDTGRKVEKKKEKRDAMLPPTVVKRIT